MWLAESCGGSLWHGEDGSLGEERIMLLSGLKEPVKGRILKD